MSKFLEATFVVGCALVGLSMNSPVGNPIHDTVTLSVEAITLAQSNIASNVSKLQNRLLAVPVPVLPAPRRD